MQATTFNVALAGVASLAGSAMAARATWRARRGACSSALRFETPHGVVHVATRSDLARCPAWEQAFSHQRKDRRFFEIVEDTILQGFEYRYLILEDDTGKVRAVQPCFILDQDLLAGSGPRVQAAVAKLRRAIPRALKMKTLMVGCAAGEGHLPIAAPDQAAWIGECLQDVLRRYARQARASLVVLKEFSSEYRQALECFRGAGYTRVPSLPGTRLSIDYPDFDTYFAKALSKATRKDLRRKFKDTAAAGIEMHVVDDITPYVDEVYPLYLQVFERSALHFEKLTKEFLCRLGREMPDKVRFFIWRQGGRAIAFNLCMLNGDSIYDEYLGMDYLIALDLHLYFYTIRDVLQWAMSHGCKWYCSSAMGYDPKQRLGSELAPLDLYVMHTSPVINFFMKRILPLLEPTRSEKTLQKFPNYADVWGRP